MTMLVLKKGNGCKPSNCSPSSTKSILIKQSYVWLWLILSTCWCWLRLSRVYSKPSSFCSQAWRKNNTKSANKWKNETKVSPNTVANCRNYSTANIPNNNPNRKVICWTKIPSEEQKVLDPNTRLRRKRIGRI